MTEPLRQSSIPSPTATKESTPINLAQAVKFIEAKRAAVPKPVELMSAGACAAELVGLMTCQSPPFPRMRTLDDGQAFVKTRPDFYEPPVVASYDFWPGCGLDDRSRAIIDAGDLYDVPEAQQWWDVYTQLLAKLGTGMLVCLVGAWGSGKTLMAGQLLREVCNRGWYKPRIYNAMTIFRKLRAAFDGGPSEESRLKEFASYSLLVIDEADKRGNTEYEDQRLVEIVNLRYGRMNDTILISNLSPKDFAASVGGAVIDRARQCGGIIECQWPSYRKADA